MKTQEIPMPIIPRKYGVTERKKNELDTLSLQVLTAQLEVEKFQAVVTALSEKFTQFQKFLSTADNDRTAAFYRVNQITQLVQSTLDLRENSDVSFNEIVLANSKTKHLAIKVKNVLDKLIFSAEVINKLANVIIKRKALNPLISDELVSRIKQSGIDANNAVALTLASVQSTFAAQASNMESEQAASLEFAQSMLLYQLLSGTDLDGKPDPQDKGSLCFLLAKAYKMAKRRYDQVQNDCIQVTLQLNAAKTLLSKAQVKLKSLQSGLAAANAAALA